MVVKKHICAFRGPNYDGFRNQQPFGLLHALGYYLKSLIVPLADQFWALQLQPSIPRASPSRCPDKGVKIKKVKDKRAKEEASKCEKWNVSCPVS
uniref:Ovule protein n=1 Tax=Steinernema glaseri TaxID=37863 RepID=A0A1I7XWK6_9BILA